MSAAPISTLKLTFQMSTTGRYIRDGILIIRFLETQQRYCIGEILPAYLPNSFRATKEAVRRAKLSPPSSLSTPQALDTVPFNDRSGGGGAGG